MFGVYRVDSGSMEPWLHGTAEGGELVLVRYTKRPALERFAPLVIVRPGEEDPVVKRLAGLPGDSVQIAGGDLLIDGVRLGAGSQRPPSVVIFDQRREPFDESFQLTGEGWRPAGAGAWLADARAGFSPGTRPPRAVYRRTVLDDYPSATGQLVRGVQHVGDLALELDVSGFQDCGLALQLTEGGDRFELRIQCDSGYLTFSLLRLGTGDAPEELGSSGRTYITDPLLELGARRLRFSNVDNVLSVQLSGEGALLEVPYDANTKLESAPDPTSRHLRPRVSIEVLSGEATLGNVRILRDLHYTSRGEYAVRGALRLGPDELFVLGDNSRESLDGRDFGPITTDQVIGVPMAVVWPPAAWRRLSGPAASDR